MNDLSDLLSRLGAEFPRAAIKHRQGGGGRGFDYFETHTIINRLNNVAESWDFRITRFDLQGDTYIAIGELTIPGLGTRTGIGVQRVSERSGEDLVKGVSSDALKKAATLFGVGLELYGPDYEGGETAHQEPPAKSRQPKQPAPDAKFMKYRERVNELWQDATMAGHREQTIIDHLRTTYQTPTINGLTLEQLSEFGHWLHDLAAQPADVEVRHE